jgi:hypothetical protein
MYLEDIFNRGGEQAVKVEGGLRFLLTTIVCHGL